MENEGESRRLWQDRLVSNTENVNKLINETGLSPLVVQVCVNRGLGSTEEILNFLSPKLENLKDPYSIKDMDLAIDRMVLARQNQEKVRVFGDYDVDGTTAASLLALILKEFGFQFDVRQPDRFKDGYGLNVGAVENAFKEDVSLLITVDTGITSFDAAQKAKELGLDLIIIDHHQVDSVRGMPKALAVLDPQRPDCQSGLKELCGCGLAFYFARALRTRGKSENWWPGGKEPNLKQHLDLVVIATSADMVPLVGDNHILTRHGLSVLEVTQKPGVKALLEVSGLSKKNLSPSHLGFVLGPRINASGRMSHASLAFELLTTDDVIRASEIALEIEKLNRERAHVQDTIWEDVKLKVEEGIKQGRFLHAVVVGNANWHEGVIGIVASRVVETFQKPTVIISFRDEIGKGSVRSCFGKDVLLALRLSAKYLKSFGGHKYAAGLSIDKGQCDNFCEAFNQALSQIPEDLELKPLVIEGSCSVEELNFKTFRELESLGPFGPGNSEIIFRVKAMAASHQILKGKHIKFRLSSIDLDMKKYINAIWFHALDHEQEFSFLKNVKEWACIPELNRYGGFVTPTLRIKDFKKI
ncbi:MAG: single-stranded-DNA-specific exonuclease RecJ [Bdellovibrio sp.]|nr:single-stranded-DNA-specific exonuclease RecJ [Bdellovibrio sp.]